MIGLVARTFDDVATQWSAFEREFVGLQDRCAKADYKNGLKALSEVDTHQRS